MRLITFHPLPLLNHSGFPSYSGPRLVTRFNSGPIQRYRVANWPDLHPHCLYLEESWSLSQLSLGAMAGSTLQKSRRGQLNGAHWQMCMSFDCGRKLEYLARTNTDIRRTCKCEYKKALTTHTTWAIYNFTFPLKKGYILSLQANIRDA